MPFLVETLDVRMTLGADSDRRILALLSWLPWQDPITGELHAAPIGTLTDGVSDPELVQNIIPAFGRAAWMAIIHDAGYQSTLLTWNHWGNTWIPYQGGKAGLDTILKRMLDEYQVYDEAIREAVYLAVSKGGMPSWENDLAEARPPITVPPKWTGA